MARNPALDLRQDKMNKLFKQQLPESLYMSSYDLHSEIRDFSQEEWEHFLDSPDTQRFIESKMAKLTEVNARKAVHRLGTTTGFASQEVTALKEIIEKSKLMQQGQNRRPKVVLTYIPPRFDT